MSNSTLSLTRLCAQIFLTLALAFAILLLAPDARVAQAQANPPPLDHFRCYPLLEGPQPDIDHLMLGEARVARDL